MIIYLLAHICLLHSLIRHETKVDVWEVGPLTHKARHTSEQVQSEPENLFINLFYSNLGGGNTTNYFKKSFQNKEIYYFVVKICQQIYE